MSAHGKGENGNFPVCPWQPVAVFPALSLSLRNYSILVSSLYSFVIKDQSGYGLKSDPGSVTAVPALSESQEKFAGLKTTFAALSVARTCRSEFQPALQRAGEANPGDVFPLKKMKLKRARAQLTSNKSMKEATWFSGRNAPKGKKKQKLKPDDDQP